MHSNNLKVLFVRLGMIIIPDIGRAVLNKTAPIFHHYELIGS